MSVTGAELPRPFPIRRRFFAHADRSFFLRWTTLALLLCLWEAGARVAGNTGLIAPPTSVVRALFAQVLSDPDVRGALFSAVLEVSAAYALAVCGGLLIGLAVGWTRFGRNSMFPIILLFYAIPQAVLLPLVTLGFGIGPTAKIAFGCSHGIFPVIVNTVAGMRNINPLYASAVRAMGGSRRDIIRNVILPHMVGSFFAGLRLAMTMTLLGVILAELYVSTGGIGYYTRQFADNFDPAPLFALVFALAMIAIAMNTLVRFAERRYTRWKD